MFNQHAKWLKVTRAIAWRRPIASLNLLLSAPSGRQHHTGCAKVSSRTRTGTCGR